MALPLTNYSCAPSDKVMRMIKDAEDGKFFRWLVSPDPVSPAFKLANRPEGLCHVIAHICIRLVQQSMAFLTVSCVRSFKSS